MEDDRYFKNYFYDFLAPASVLNAEKPVRGIKLFYHSSTVCSAAMTFSMKSENQCEECDDQLKILMFQRTADSLGQADQGEAWEVLENPIEEIIAGYIIDVVKEYNNVLFVL